MHCGLIISARLLLCLNKLAHAKLFGDYRFATESDQNADKLKYSSSPFLLYL